MNEQEVNNLIADAFEKVCEIMGLSSAIHPHFHDALFSAAQQTRKSEWPKYTWRIGKTVWWEYESDHKGDFSRWLRGKIQSGEVMQAYSHVICVCDDIIPITQAEADYLARKFTVPEGWEIGELIQASKQTFTGAWMGVNGKIAFTGSCAIPMFLKGYRWGVKQKACNRCGAPSDWKTKLKENADV